MAGCRRAAACYSALEEKRWNRHSLRQRVLALLRLGSLAPASVTMDTVPVGDAGDQAEARRRLRLGGPRLQHRQSPSFEPRYRLLPDVREQRLCSGSAFSKLFPKNLHLLVLLGSIGGRCGGGGGRLTIGPQ